MKGTASKDAGILYRGIIEYFSTISALDATVEMLSKRDKIVADNGIICDDSLDEQVLELQERFISADGDGATQKAIVEETLTLLLD